MRRWDLPAFAGCLASRTSTLRAASLIHSIVVLAALTACATADKTAVSPSPRIAADKPFVMDGRLSARRSDDAIAAHFTWLHDPPQDELRIMTPLGQEVAELRGDTRVGRVTMRTSDGRSGEAPDWSSMTEQALGYRLPVDELAAWVAGAPYGTDSHTVEYDSAGRPLVLRQQGWEVIYAYPDERASRPSGVRVIYPDLEVRIVIDSWE